MLVIQEHLDLLLLVVCHELLVKSLMVQLGVSLWSILTETTLKHGILIGTLFASLLLANLIGDLRAIRSNSKETKSLLLLLDLFILVVVDTW